MAQSKVEAHPLNACTHISCTPGRRGSQEEGVQRRPPMLVGGAQVLEPTACHLPERDMSRGLGLAAPGTQTHALH